jgi:hypothetical protein
MMLCGSLDLIGHQPNDVVARKPGKNSGGPHESEPMPKFTAAFLTRWP